MVEAWTIQTAVRQTKEVVIVIKCFKGIMCDDDPHHRPAKVGAGVYLAVEAGVENHQSQG